MQGWNNEVKEKVNGEEDLKETTRLIMFTQQRHL